MTELRPVLLQLSLASASQSARLLWTMMDHWPAERRRPRGNRRRAGGPASPFRPAQLDRGGCSIVIPSRWVSDSEESAGPLSPARRDQLSSGGAGAGRGAAKWPVARLG